ncbi:MAG: hypothetical protein EOO77_47495 [Oxalobacteraceae bacterium]|nr:MAG: hypothetical protein EOO77_47495 [Oxalobacteraceae bacterium]
MLNPKYNGWLETQPRRETVSFRPGTYGECVKDAFPYFPFWIRADHSFGRADEVAEWCEERFGRSALNRRPDELALRYPAYWVDLTRDWVAFTGDYLFVHSDHAFEFKMRWI